MKEVVIVSAVRTPIGSFLGSLSEVSATRLGAAAIKGALNKINLDPKMIDEVFMGNVVQAGLGQAPAKQAALYAGIPDTVPCTTVNKVCASGMKSIAFAAQAVKCGDAEIVVAGGMENMSSIPHYMNGRKGQKFGNIQIEDGLLKDGLVNVYDGKHMGTCGDACAEKYEFSREDQDNFAIESYKRSADAWSSGKFKEEVIPVEIPQRRGEPVILSEDEEFKNIKMEKVPNLRPAFSKEGTVTAANASTLNDGAAALVIMSRQKADELGLKPMAVINGYADASQEPEWFTTAPAKALPKALDKAGISQDQVDFYELNEAFSVVGLANIKLLNLDPSKVNVHGGAVSLGHPLGCSGARIIVTLIHVLRQNNGKNGAAGICNGGGGASAMVISLA
ncbi:acetyl-CoA C-acyltransferase [Lutimonas zeaxanthinifaciens]|uniref:acetyl-CoA C-acyltransferase n=1 Tax=Lutimonas zeaxanthinifaciens TaxID=3060215 RepID=UPI00265D3627|nr:acetyl-CoA C-acyltransferase [Lutimonas sp. YSD2104]WKK67393.1 acetyl-CoA C-acyltransferase [Lutimonas sp. YSD2104]